MLHLFISVRLKSIADASTLSVNMETAIVILISSKSISNFQDCSMK